MKKITLLIGILICFSFLMFNSYSGNAYDKADNGIAFEINDEILSTDCFTADPDKMVNVNVIDSSSLETFIIHYAKAPENYNQIKPYAIGTNTYCTDKLGSYNRHKLTGDIVRNKNCLYSG